MAPKGITGVTVNTLLTEILPAIVVPIALGWLTNSATRNELQTWYRNLKKPSWTPPDSAFPIVWTILYAMMGYASWLIYQSGPMSVIRFPLIMYAVQLLLNISWSPIFWKAHAKNMALYEICALWVAIASCIIIFYPLNKVASYLMMPYLAWVTLATALNYRIAKDNPRKGRTSPAGRINSKLT
ncbi:hypothetical protein RvY_16182 [Ramazzottius varieornatus]|uniref:TspO/MBR-related protein n=1 Tax=Ramazzottius varieornatus TaxID=947166 RepID=A0A1D1W428_RAMVA|nr:hypothetical protein RvY_16182 [Ramazzottius varieornatus]